MKKVGPHQAPTDQSSLVPLRIEALSHVPEIYRNYRITCQAPERVIVSPTELEKYLYDHIPMSKAMQVSVVSVHPDSIVLSAPLAPNINHRDTVFGGSASAVAILAAWSLLHTRLAASGISSRLVIQRNTMNYELPIPGTFTARSFIAPAAGWESFLRMLNRKGRARVTVSCVLEYAGRAVGRLEGEFVALGAGGA